MHYPRVIAIKSRPHPGAWLVALSTRRKVFSVHCRAMESRSERRARIAWRVGAFSTVTCRYGNTVEVEILVLVLRHRLFRHSIQADTP